MVKKEFKKEKKGSASAKASADKAEKLKELRLEELGDIPLVGGLFKGLSKLIDLAERVEEAGGEIKKKGEIKGKEGVKGIYGFSIRTGIGEKPKIQTFGNIRPVKPKERAKPELKITETREPIADVFDEKDHILIVAELPGVKEEEIKTTLKGDILILEASNGERKYYKEILLPSKIDAGTEEISYKNGVLEVKFKKT